MVLSHFYYLIEEKSKSDDDDSNSISPLFGLEYLFLLCTVYNITKEFLTGFWFSLLSQLHSSNSNVLGEKPVSENEITRHHHENQSENSTRGTDEKLQREQIEMVMARLGLFCSSESEELEETYGSKELSDMFEEQEPSLAEVKQAFDVFDQNKDGFIDAGELQRVLCILGLKEARKLDNCHKMIKNFDENRDGRIDFNEFVKIMENSFC